MARVTSSTPSWNVSPTRTVAAGTKSGIRFASHLEQCLGTARNDRTGRIDERCFINREGHLAPPPPGLDVVIFQTCLTGECVTDGERTLEFNFLLAMEQPRPIELVKAGAGLWRF